MDRILEFETMENEKSGENETPTENDDSSTKKPNIVDWKKLMKHEWHEASEKIKVYEAMQEKAEREQKTVQEQRQHAEDEFKRASRYCGTLERIVSVLPGLTVNKVGVYYILVKKDWKKKKCDQESEYTIVGFYRNFEAAFDKFVQTANQNCKMSRCYTYLPCIGPNGYTFFNAILNIPGHPKTLQVYFATEKGSGVHADTVDIFHHAEKLLTEAKERLNQCEQTRTNTLQKWAEYETGKKSPKVNAEKIDFWKRRQEILEELGTIPGPSVPIYTAATYVILEETSVGEYVLKHRKDGFAIALTYLMNLCADYSHQYQFKNEALCIGENAVTVLVAIRLNLSLKRLILARL